MDFSPNNTDIQIRVPRRTSVKASLVNGGDVHATFETVDAAKPMSFISFNGDVDVTLPANLAADLIVGSQQGDVFTDFEVVAQNDPPNMQQRAGPKGGNQIRVTHNTRYAIGGGGPDITLRTFNGDVMIRKR